MTKTYNKVLVIHCHTTGINYGDDVTMGQQPLSIALGVVDMLTLKIIDSINVMIAFDPKTYIWSNKIAAIHGISKDKALEGESFSDAAGICAEFLYNNFGVKEPIPTMGYNTLSFHVPFLRKILKSEDLDFKFDNRDIDLFPIMTLLGKYTLKDVFELFEVDQSEPLSSLFIIKTYVKIYKAIQSKLKEISDG